MPILSTTRSKIFLAKGLYLLLRPFLGNFRTVQRKGIRYDLQLNEGIDFSIFLFGAFQKYLFRSRYFSLAPDAVVFDVGANIGTSCLAFAKTARDGKVFAFEPTDYAYKKLQRNLALNPQLQKRVIATQAFLTDGKGAPKQAYSRWPLLSDPSVHALHGGALEAAETAKSLTLDDAANSLGIERLDLIKIDTDGSELTVLQGALRSIGRFRPAVVFEVGQYLLEERGISFLDFISLLGPQGYRFYDLKTEKEITDRNYSDCIPRFSTTDLIAVPNARA